jgi:hypothetical protein
MDKEGAEAERVVGVSFQRAATQILLCSSNAPKAMIRGVVQAGKVTFAQAAIFWGCAG